MIFWQLRLFSDCELLTADGRPVSLSTRKSLAILGYLARQTEHRAKRLRLASLLWEDVETEQGRLHVRKALWLIRTEARKSNAEAPPPVEANGDSVALAAATIQTDVDIFLRAVEEAGDDSAALEAACDLYTGDFLSEFVVRNAPAFEDWALGERQHLREIAIGARSRLVDLLSADPAGTEAAMRATVRLLQLDPLQEHAHRAMMRLHVRQGRPAAALSQYHQLRETLRRELAVEPEPATQALFREIGYNRRNRDPKPTNAKSEGIKTAVHPLNSDPIAYARPRNRNWRRAGVVAVVVIAMAGLIWRSDDLISDPTPSVDRLFPISTNLVVSGRPAISPDGSRLAFTARKPEGTNVDLYLLTLGDARPLRITDDAAIDDDAAWSPDGTSLAFVRAVPTGGTPCQILIKTVPSGSERIVGGCKTSRSTRLAWAKDGRSLYFSDQTNSDAPPRIFSLTLESGLTQALTSPPSDTFGDRQAVPSPDGRHLAFLREAAGRSTDLYLLDLFENTLERLTSEGGIINGLAWDPSGKGLIYSSDRGGDIGLWWAPLGGGPSQRLSSGVLDYRNLSSARDRGRLVVEAVQDRSTLQISAAEGRGFIPLKELAANARDTFPDLASDGSLAFVSTRSGEEQIWIAKPDSVPRQLSNFHGWRISEPRWSHDANQIAFIASRRGMTDLYVIDRDGGSPRRLTQDTADDSAPAWSRDDRHVYFSSRRGGASRIWRIAASGSASTTAEAVSPEGPGDLRVDDSGRWLFYLYPGKRGIWRRALDAQGRKMIGEEQLLATDFEPLDWQNWAVDDARVCYAARPNGIGAGSVKCLDLETGITTIAADAGTVHRQSSFTLAPGGKIIAPIREVEISLFGMDLNR